MLALAAPTTVGRARFDVHMASQGPQYGDIYRVDANGPAVCPPTVFAWRFAVTPGNGTFDLTHERPTVAIAVVDSVSGEPGRITR